MPPSLALRRSSKVQDHTCRPDAEAPWPIPSNPSRRDPRLPSFVAAPGALPWSPRRVDMKWPRSDEVRRHYETNPRGVTVSSRPCAWLGKAPRWTILAALDRPINDAASPQPPAPIAYSIWWQCTANPLG